MKQINQAQTKLFKVLSHPTRLAILDILRHGEECVCHMEDAFGLRQAHISQHLMVLREAGLVADRRDGWNIFYKTTVPEIYTVIDSMNILCGVEISVDLDGNEEHTENYTCPCPKCNLTQETMTIETHLIQSE